MPKLLKKLIFSSLAFLVVFLSIVPNLLTAKAATGDDIYNLWNHTWYSEQDPFAWYKKVYDTNTSPDSEIFGERYTAAQVQWVMYGIFGALWNLIPGNPELTVCATGGNLQSCTQVVTKVFNVLSPINLPGGASTGTTSPVASLFSIVGQSPVSGVYYIKNLVSKFSIVTPVNAQGFGYTTAGNSIIALWRASRNIAYGLTIPVVLILAFMIMFRVKISPQVVISVQSAIPKLIITLILITFSYAIAGFAVDLMYVVIGLIAAALTGAHLSSATTPDLFRAFTTYYNAFTLMYYYWIQLVLTTITTLFSGYGLGILVFIVAVFAILAVIWWSLKIIFFIFKYFALVIITIAIGPLEILLGAVTGSAGFGSWFKRLLAYLAVYPLTGLLFFLSFFFLQQGADTSIIGSWSSVTPFSPVSNVITGNQWVPPFFPGVAGAYRLLWVGASLFIFSQITKVADIIQSAISGKPFNYGSAIGEAAQTTGSVLQLAPKEKLTNRLGQLISTLGAQISRG